MVRFKHLYVVFKYVDLQTCMSSLNTSISKDTIEGSAIWHTCYTGVVCLTHFFSFDGLTIYVTKIHWKSHFLNIIFTFCHNINNA